MILTCPQCETRFLVPAGAVPAAGRKVRCAKCGHIWHADPVDDTDSGGAAAPAPAKPSKKEKRLKIKGEKKPFFKLLSNSGEKRKKALALLAGFFLVIALFGVFRFAFPTLVMGQGLVFTEVAIEWNDMGMTVTGAIVNEADGRRGVPPIRITAVFSGTDGDTVVFMPERPVLGEGDVLPFSYSLADIPQDVTDLTIGFQAGEAE